MKLFGLKQETGRAANIWRIFLFFFWGSLVPIMAISGIVYFSGRTILEKQVTQSLSALNRSRSERLDIFIEKLKVRTADWASDGRIRQDVERIRKGEPLSDGLSSYLRDEKLPIDPTVVLADVLDVRGIVIASSDISRLGKDEGGEHISFPEASRASFGEAVFTPELVVEADELTGVPMLHFASPLVSAETDTTVGVLLVHVRNDELNKIFAAKDETTLETYIVNREKLMLTSSRFVADAVLVQTVDTPPVRACLDRGKEYQGSHLDYRGEPVIGVSTCLPAGLGVVVTETDTSEAFASIYLFRSLAVSAVTIILALVLMFIFLSGRGMLPRTTTTTIIIIIIIGVAFSLFLSKSIEQFVWRVKTESVLDLVQAQAGRHVGDATYFSNWQSADSQRRFGDYASELKSALPPVAAAKIFNDEAVLVWSDSDKAAIGQKEENADVTEALAGKQKIESAEANIQKQLGLPHLLEIYTPVFLGNGASAVGVVEIYFDTSDLHAFVRRTQMFVWILVAGALVVITSILLFAFREQNRKIAEQAREISVIVEKSPIGVFALNKDGIIESFNPKMVEMTGAEHAEKMIGLNAFELPAYKVAGLDGWFRAGLAGKPFETEVRQVSSTGGKESWSHYYGTPLFGSDGKTVDRLLLMVSDITERKRLEAEIEDYAKGLERKIAERTKDLERINKVLIGRELRMVELKKQLAEATGMTAKEDAAKSSPKT